MYTPAAFHTLHYGSISRA